MSLSKKALAGIAVTVATVATVGVTSAPAQAATCLGIYTMQAANGYYVQTDEDHPTYPGIMRAIATGVGNWEKFRVYQHIAPSGLASASFRALNGKYVKVGTLGGRSNVLSATAGSDTSTNTLFTWPSGKSSPTNNSWESFMSNTAGRWVSNEEAFTGEEAGMLRARATSVGTWEKFYFRRVSGC